MTRIWFGGTYVDTPLSVPEVRHRVVAALTDQAPAIEVPLIHGDATIFVPALLNSGGFAPKPAEVVIER